MARQEDNGLIFVGQTFIRNRNIADSGFVDVGNVTSLALKSESETKTRVSKQRNSVGQALDSVVTPQPTTVTLKSDTFDRQNLALALMGQDSVFTQTAETITDHLVTIGKKGQWYSLGKTAIEEVTVKNSSDANVDAAAYQINADLGMIMILESSSTIMEGSEIKVSFKTQAKQGFKIDAGTVASWDLEVRVVGENRVTGKTGILHIPHMSVGADSEIDWFSDEFAESSFSGNVIKSGSNAPYSFTETN